jgi:hypothetical protein
MRGAFSLGLLMALAACGGGLPRDYAVICINEVGAPGEYDYFPSDEIPVVFPAQDGNVPGAERINACIREKAAKDGLI